MNRPLGRLRLLTRPTGIAGDSDEAPLIAENAGERRFSLCFEDINPARKAPQMSSRPYRIAILALAAVPGPGLVSCSAPAMVPHKCRT